MMRPYNWPPVVFLVVTWNRPKEIRQTLRALFNQMTYPGKTALHIADDNSETVCPGYIRDLVAEAKGFWPGPITFTVTDRAGWGANVNTAFRFLKKRQFNYIFQIEDDYVLRQPLDLRHGVLVLQGTERIGMVRYRGIQGHRVAGAMKEVKVPAALNIQQARGLHGKIGYWELVPRLSRELYVYSHGPHLKDFQRFHGDYGLYREGVSLGATEESFAHEVKDRPKSRVAVLPEWALMWFDHIGQSRQHTEADIETIKPDPEPEDPEGDNDQKT